MEVLVPPPVVVPLTAAAVIAGFGRFVRSRLVDATAILVAAGVTAITAWLLAASLGDTLTYWYGGWQPVGGLAIGIAFVVQPFGAALALLTSVVTLVTLVFSYRYFEEVGALFHVQTLIFLAAMCGFALTGDLFNLFVFFELMSVTAFALTAYRSDQGAPLQGALNFTVVNTVAAILILFGIGLLYGRTDALNLDQLGSELAGVQPDALLVMSFVLITCGFLVKAAVVPFHFWLANAYAVAPAPAAVLFSAVMSDLGLYAAAEIYWTVFAGPFGPHAGAIGAVLLALGAVTALVGAIMCASQRSLKRMFAFATISHIGLFLIGIALLEVVGLAGAMLYLFCDGLVKGDLFLAAGVLAYQLRSGDELELHGRGRQLPVVGVAMALGGLALATLPPFGTFLGKALIEESAHRVGVGWVPWLLLIAEAITGGTVLRATGRIFLGLGSTQDSALSRQDDDSPEEEPSNRTGRNLVLLVAPVVALIAGGLAVSFIPHLADAAVTAAHRFVARPLHLSNTHERAPLMSSTAYLFGAGAAAGAVAFAVATLAGPRLERLGVRRATAVLRPAAQTLRALHFRPRWGLRDLACPWRGRGGNRPRDHHDSLACGWRLRSERSGYPASGRARCAGHRSSIRGSGCRKRAVAVKVPARSGAGAASRNDASVRSDGGRLIRQVEPWSHSRLRRAALWTWTLLGMAGLLVFGWLVFLRLEVVLVPILPISGLARRAALALSGGVTALLAAALNIGTGIVLAVVLWAVYLSGGPRIARTGLRLVPSRHRPDARELGARVWHTLGSYTRALTAVATFDATAVGVGL
ncbi:MAG: proton-conducting transporter membrane subunit, partial [Pseudonocardiaceae bacterium]